MTEGEEKKSWEEYCQHFFMVTGDSRRRNSMLLANVDSEQVQVWICDVISCRLNRNIAIDVVSKYFRISSFLSSHRCELLERRFYVCFVWNCVQCQTFRTEIYGEENSYAGIFMLENLHFICFLLSCFLIHCRRRSFRVFFWCLRSPSFSSFILLSRMFLLLFIKVNKNGLNANKLTFLSIVLLFSSPLAFSFSPQEEWARNLQWIPESDYSKIQHREKHKNL